MNFPKVLIIGQPFGLGSGGAITQTNLFYGWPKEKLAVIAVGNTIRNLNIDICDNYYSLGNTEYRWKFPFSIFQKKIKSGSIIIENYSLSKQKKDIPRKTLRQIIYDRYFFPFLKYTGLIHFISKIEISNNLLSWVNQFDPDVIYVQASSREFILFSLKIENKIRKPIVLHVMDDWPKTISNKGLFKNHWSKRIDKELKILFSKSKKLLSISEAMSLEYKNRYGLEFVPFHNPIDLKFWSDSVERSYKINGVFNILYAGRVGKGIRNSIHEIALAVETLRTKGLNIKFNIQATNADHILDTIKKYEFVNLLPVVSYSDLPGIFRNADLLIIANDFDDESISFLKLSMPTKASEYMASGTPILLYSDISTAISKHAQKYNWGYLVSEHSVSKLETAICELYKNDQLRKNLGDSAKEFAFRYFDGENIRDKFRNALNSVITTIDK